MMMDDLNDKHDLIGMAENEILQLLGKPDITYDGNNNYIEFDQYVLDRTLEYYLNDTVLGRKVLMIAIIDDKVAYTAISDEDS